MSYQAVKTKIDCNAEVTSFICTKGLSWNTESNTLKNVGKGRERIEERSLGKTTIVYEWQHANENLKCYIKLK